ncbi:McrB family protein [Pseudomonas aeruginosa]
MDISEVARSREIAELLWDLKETYPRAERAQQDVLIRDTWREVSRLVGLLAKRTPKLKMYRVFALLCPGAFTTIAHFRKLRELASVMGVSTQGVEHTLHRAVLDHLSVVLGESGEVQGLQAIERMTLPWLLYVEHVQSPQPEATETADVVSGEVRLKHLPPERRRRGMLGIGGGTATVLAMIEFAREGCTREDFIEHLQSINPQSKKSTLNTQFNALLAEWGVLHAEGNKLQLTPRGEAFLDSGDPDEVIDWMITHILGFDNLLHVLMQSPTPSSQAILTLQKVNPGWTSDFAPNVLINWFRNLQLVELDAQKRLSLTERGKQWARRIHWTPGVLSVPSSPIESTVEVGKSGEVAPEFGCLERLPLSKIIEGFDPTIQFPKELIGQLDAGLWSHPRRHFAVLTGLSGAGKTQLARGYARSLWKDTDNPQDGLLIVPVQPGWHDPASLFGYVNPLDNDTYIRTKALSFLLRASADPSRPYTLVLDEMNLSHPEQYLAPLLSAMETGDDIELHAQDADVNGVPCSIPYPANLILIGTVNMDETTHGLSDKVLDRASVIEFWDIDVDVFPGWENSSLQQERLQEVRHLMKVLMQALRPVRLHFGWRTLQDVIGYLQEAERGGIIEFSRALDQAVYTKILPKLRGEDSPRLQKVFTETRDILRGAELNEASAKVAEMLDDLRHLGAARFWR